MESRGIRIITRDNSQSANHSHIQDILKSEPSFSIQQLLDYVEGNKHHLKAVSHPVKGIQEKAALHDIGIKVRGPQEDKIYLSNPIIQKNIRRGNTLLEYEDGTVIMARKGLTKFYDLTNDQLSPDSDQQQHKKPDTNQKNYTLGPCQEAFRQNKCVTIYKTLKANGENAQVSYIKDLNRWVIASKNVSLIAGSSQDLDLYKGDRFHFAVLIADTWFRLINDLDDLLLQQLKRALQGFTLIGEYVGNQDYQHLIKYQKQTILFYAMVNNESSQICNPIMETQELLKKFSLDFVKIEDMGTYTNYTAFCDKLNALYKQVAESPINSEEEGSVLYFEAIDSSEKRQVLSLCKLKTLEYRVFRKLREKLRNFIQYYHESDGQADPKVKLNQFKEETKALCNGFRLPQPLKFYMDIGELAMKSLYSNKRQYFENLLQERYIDFLKKIMLENGHFNKQEVENYFGSVAFEGQAPEKKSNGDSGALTIVLVVPPLIVDSKDIENIALKFDMMFRVQPIITKIQPTEKHQVIMTYVVEREILEQSKAQVYKYKVDQQNITIAVERIMKQKDQSKDDEFLSNIKSKNQGVQYLYDLLQPVLADPKVIEIVHLFELSNILLNSLPFSLKPPKQVRFANNDNEEEEKTQTVSQIIPQSFSSSHYPFKHKNVVLSIGIPGIGKSTIIKILKQSLPDFQTDHVSSDEIRLNLMEIYLKRNPGHTQDSAFKAVDKQAKNKFDEEFRNKLKQLQFDKRKSILFIDKNMIPNNIGKTVQQIRQFAKDSHIIAMFPKVEKPLEFYPYSIDTIIQCLLRIKQRSKTSHTLSGEDSFAKSIQIFFMFLKQFRKVRFDQGFLDTYGIADYLEIEMTKESKFPLFDGGHLKETVISILDQTVPGQFPKCSSLLEDLNQQLESLTTLFSGQSVNLEEKSAQFKQKFSREIKNIDSEDIKEDKNSNALASSSIRQVSIQPVDEKQIDQVPLYLGIQIQSEDAMKTYLLDSLEFLAQSLQDSYVAELSINPEFANFTYPSKFHMTTLFMKNDPNRMKSKLYSQFVENKDVCLRVGLIVIVQDKIITSAGMIEDQAIQSENEIPHITLMTGAWKAVQSNDILKALFNQKYGAKKDTYKQFQENTLKEGYAEKCSVMLKNQQETCYLVYLKKQILEGKMQKFFS